MGRTREFDPDAVLSQAMKVFWSRGFEQTSIEDIVSETGVNRASLYGTFGDKKAIFVRAFDRYVKDSAVLRLDAATQSGEFRPALENMFEHMVTRSLDGRCAGCMITNTVAEFGSRDSDVLAQAREALALLENALDGCLRRAQALGEIPKDADPRARARHLLATMQGLQVISKVNPDAKALRQIAERAVETALA